MTMMSDRRAKTEIVPLGRHARGFVIYRFRYCGPHAERFGSTRRVGVMADEVAAQRPDAVVRDDEGYLRVDYRRLFQ